MKHLYQAVNKKIKYKLQNNVSWNAILYYYYYSFVYKFIDVK